MVLFSVIMIMAVVFLFTRPQTTLGWFGLPSWLYGFLIIELTYCAAMWLFVERFWDHQENQD